MVLMESQEHCFKLLQGKKLVKFVRDFVKKKKRDYRADFDEVSKILFVKQSMIFTVVLFLTYETKSSLLSCNLI